MIYFLKLIFYIDTLKQYLPENRLDSDSNFQKIVSRWVGDMEKLFKELSQNGERIFSNKDLEDIKTLKSIPFTLDERIKKVKIEEAKPDFMAKDFVGGKASPGFRRFFTKINNPVLTSDQSKPYKNVFEELTDNGKRVFDSKNKKDVADLQRITQVNALLDEHIAKATSK